MRISSSAFQDKGTIPAKYTCDGNNIIPPISISDVPEGTKTLTLIMDDPDVPKSIRPDGIFDHWLVWNIPADVKEIREGEAPAGIEGKNTRGDKKYTGPCPPDREHRYFFKLYALDAELELDPNTTTKGDLMHAMDGHIIAEVEFMGRYERP
ncbi:MAG: kinase inhibitor [Candidatus Colwellbacteria bacterium RIFCSPLOWO2_12_FULL_46_17]|uniref:Kinase inhibitor n=2 Tax=Candidatus Colwelliibacteriota TaxID=1817904 RepID=A0A1G1ZE22_9BACT|nr:MAG: kinase inhibitor [Candidatus Colwellbacteria bacterium RIFCSPLOWO2_02_FULL_45_11]OGY62150.1 MAG: kinase inhibitor [Candidatus Colwellbacteria bacterium RIFCSPLOWO2_12_FULL_46_17]